MFDFRHCIKVFYYIYTRKQHSRGQRCEIGHVRMRKSNAVPIALLQVVPLACAPVAEAYASMTVFSRTLA